MVINQSPTVLTASTSAKGASVSITAVKMLPSIAPSKFDICLLSGFLFNFACVTAQYWPYNRAYSYGQSSDPYGSPTSPYGSQSQSPYGSPSGYQVSSGPIRVQSFPQSLYGQSPPPTQSGPVQRYDPYPGGYGGASPLSPSSSSYPGQPSYQPQPSYSGQPQQNYGQSIYGHSWSSPAQSPSYQRPYDYSGYPRTGPPTPQPQPYYPPRSQQSWYNQPRPSYQATSSYFPEVDRRSGYPQVNPQYPTQQYQSQYPPPPMSGGGYYPPPPMQYQPRMPTTAIAKMKGNGNKIEGEIRFVQADNRYIQITGRIMGLVPGAHGLHVHEGVSTTGGDTCANIGGHFNPSGSDHGGKSEWIRHVGDLGNIFADHDGTAFFDITDSMVSLHGPNSITNRTIVVTEFGDDLGKGSNPESKIHGNAGKPLVCGQIVLSTAPMRLF